MTNNSRNTIGRLSPRIIFFSIFLGILFVSIECGQKSIKSQPNIIFIFADQFRQYSLGFWSQGKNAQYIQGNPDPVVTPALDKLANQGIVFSRSVSNFPLCSPYRGMLLSGMYPDHNGLTTNCRNDRKVQLKTDLECVTDIFSKAGYATAYFGKCHWQKTEPLFDEQGNYQGSTVPPGGHYVNRYDTYVPPGPDRHHIDYFFQLLKDDHFNPRCYSNDPKLVAGKKDGELHLPRRFSSELESEAIIDYLSNTHKQRNEDKPFFLMWSLNPPHNPWTEESTYMDFFNQYTRAGKVDLSRLLTRENVDTSIGHYAPYYFANVSAVDHFIGKVLDHLNGLGLEENTIVVFSSDHGEMLGSHGKRGKNIPEIESYSIPFVIKWGNKLRHRIEDLILSVPDVMPTLLGLAGFAHLIPTSVQGKNYAGILSDPAQANIEKPSSALFINANARGVYTGDYMFVVEEENGKFKTAFGYDNKNDPYQRKRIAWGEMESSHLNSLKSALAALLIRTEDRWYQEQICNSFLTY